MHTLDHAWTGKVVNGLSHFRSVFRGENKLRFPRRGHLDLHIFIHVTISMSCQSDRLFPVLDTRFNTFYHNRCTENSSVKSSPDGAVRALPHFFQIVFCHTCSIWCNGCTFYGNTIFFCCFCRVNGYLIVCFVTMLQSQIIVLCL